ncbi:putative LRR receptor-like serine/threonine-protein kinase [Acorus calamus]|uniref:LRR receptor-like serine/threonine-protein kinase n=1 Tax=Acorus calamus TaxID=4465 RepID=A0AAV9FK32_ACOCL|nr:putative LRR receptor-like serine/threonine-protein kinase [Acorus calamus]
MRKNLMGSIDPSLSSHIVLWRCRCGMANTQRSSLCFVGRSGAQARTDPSEARALNTIFQKWNISSPSVWNVSGDVCSGSAVNGVNLFNEDSYNSTIKCVCDFNNQSTCHVTELYIDSCGASGEIPSTFMSLKSLEKLWASDVNFTGNLPDFIGSLTSLQELLRMADEEELLRTGARPHTFSYSELRTATEDFSPNKLGEGGFGSVYKGKLSDGRLVAVKQLTVASHQGKSQFVTEIATISAVQHRNLVKLHGCCNEGDKRLLLYEYLENNSLDQALFDEFQCKSYTSISLQRPCISPRRIKNSRPRIIHRDVKASNILLDADLNPKLSDFGLAKLHDDEKTHMSTRIAGTVGYLAPEYALCGHLTEKAGVFGFGVVMLEILSGRRNFDRNLEEEKAYLLDWSPTNVRMVEQGYDVTRVIEEQWPSSGDELPFKKD